MIFSHLVVLYLLDLMVCLRFVFSAVFWVSGWKFGGFYIERSVQISGEEMYHISFTEKKTNKLQRLGSTDALMM